MRIIYYGLILLVITTCAPQKSVHTVQPEKLSDDSLLTLVEYKTFQYFWDGAEPTSGAARERFHSDNVYPENDKHIITSGGTGFGVMAILVGIGVALGLPGGYGLARIVQSQLFGLRALDPATFAVATATLLVTAFVAGFLPARRATRVDPMVALRYE